MAKRLIGFVCVVALIFVSISATTYGTADESIDDGNTEIMVAALETYMPLLTVEQGCSVSCQLSDYDDGDALDFQVTLLPTRGIVEMKGDCVVYTADPGVVGDDTFEISLFLDGSLDAGYIWYFYMDITEDVPSPPPQDFSISPLQNIVEAPTQYLTVSENGSVDFDLSELLSLEGYFPPGLSYLFDVYPNGEAGSVSISGSVVIYETGEDELAQDSFIILVTAEEDDEIEIHVKFEVERYGFPEFAEAPGSFSTIKNQPYTLSLEGLATDPHGRDLTYTIEIPPLHGSTKIAMIDGFLTLTYTPDTNYTGDDSFTLRVSNGMNTDDCFYEITFTKFIPVITPDEESYTIDEDELLEFSFTVEDIDIDDIETDLTITVTSGNQAVFNDDDIDCSTELLDENTVLVTVTWQPVKDANTEKDGDVSLTIDVEDGHGGEGSVTIEITVTPVPDNPIANNDEASVKSTGDSFLIDVLANDEAPDGGALEILSVGTPTAGSAVIEGSQIRYTPDPRNKADVTFTYTIGYKDGDGILTAEGTVTVNIADDNFIPVVTPDEESYEIDEDELLVFSFTVYDRDIDDIENLKFTITSDNPDVFLNGAWTLLSSEIISSDEVRYTISWQPVKYANTTEFDEVNITIIATDERDDSSDACVLPITVNPINDPPEITPEEESYTINEDTLLTITFRVTDVDPGDLDDLIFTITSDNEDIFINEIYTLTRESIVDRTATYSLTWQPVVDANTEKDGDVSLTIDVKDGNGGEDSVTIEITVTPIPDNPIAEDDEAYADSTDLSILIDVLDNDTSVDDKLIHPLIILDVSEPLSESLTPAGSVEISVDGKIRYTLDARNKEDVTFTYTIGYEGVEDSLEATGTVTVYINAVNFIPVVTPDALSYMIDEDEPLEFTFTVQDRDIANILTDLTITIESDNQYVFADGDLNLSEPVKISDDLVRYTVTWQPRPDANTSAEYGEVNITITAADKEPGGTSPDCVIPITVAPVNDDPVLSRPLSKWRMNEDTTALFDFYVWDVDDIDPLTEFTIISVTSSAPSILDISVGHVSASEYLYEKTATYYISCTPEPNMNTSDDLDPAVNGIFITIIVEDSEGGRATAVWELLIDPVNDDPIAKNYTQTINEDEVFIFPVIADGIDIDILTNGDKLSIVEDGYPKTTTAGGRVELITIDPDDGITPLAKPYLKYTPFQDYFGTDSFEYTISDVAGKKSIGTVNLTILPVNDAPEFLDLPDKYTILEDDTNPDHYRIVFHVYDVETAPVSLMVQAASLNTSIISSVLILRENPGDLSERTLVFTLAANQNTSKSGPVQIRLVVSDSDLTTTQFIDVTVTPVNDTPVARNITYYYDEDEPLEITIASILANVTDVDIVTDNDVVSFDTFSAPSPSKGGTLVLEHDLNGDKLIFTPVKYSEETVTFTYTVKDLAGAEATATVTLVCIPVNDAPIMEEIIPSSGTYFEVDEDDSITIPIEFWDPETPNDELIIIVTASDSSVINLYSTVVDNFTEDGADLVITPIHDKNTGKDGMLLVTVTISDGVNSVFETFNLRVHPMPDAPVAVNDVYTVRAGNTLTFNPLDNDYDVDDGEIISMYHIDEPVPAEGTLDLLKDGSGRYVFIADEDFTGDVILHYQIIDNSKGDDPVNAVRDESDNPIGLLSNEGTITIHVTPQSTGPSLRALGSIVTFVSNVVELDLTVRNIPSGDPYNLSVISSNTAVISVMDITGKGSEATGLTGETQPLKLTAKAAGETLITVTLEYEDIIDSISFYVTVSAFNNPPTTKPTYGDVNEGTVTAWFDVLINCDDVEKPVNLKIMEILPAEPGKPYHATVSIVEHDGKQQIQYEAVGSNAAQLYWNGTDEINYQIVDGGGATKDGKLFVERLEFDNAPVAQRDIYYVEYSERSTGKYFTPIVDNDYDRDDQYGAHTGQSPSEKDRMTINDIAQTAGPEGATATVIVQADNRTIFFPAGMEPGWYDYSYSIKNIGWSGVVKTSGDASIWIGVKDEDGVVPPRVSSRGTYNYDEDTRTVKSGTPFSDNARSSIFAGDPYAGSEIENYRLQIEIISINSAGETILDKDAATDKYPDGHTRAGEKIGVDIIKNTAGNNLEDDDDNDDLASYTTFKFYVKDDAYGTITITWRAYVIYELDGETIKKASSNTATESILIRPVNDPPELSIATADLAGAEVTVIDPVSEGRYRDPTYVDSEGSIDLSIYILRSETAKIPLNVDDVDLDFSNPTEIAKGLTFSWKNSEEINIPVESNVHVYLDEEHYPGDNHRYILEITPIRSEQETEYNPAYLTVTVSDGFETDSVLIEVYVEPKNTPPFAREHKVTTNEDTRVSIQVVIASGTDNQVSDIDRDNLTIIIANNSDIDDIFADTANGPWPPGLGLFQLKNGSLVPAGVERGTISVAGRNIVFQPAENYNNWDDGDWTDEPLLIFFMLHDGLEYSTKVTESSDLAKYGLAGLTYVGAVGVVEIKIVAENDPPEIYGLLGDYTMLEDEEDFFITFHARDVDGDILDDDSFKVTYTDGYGHIKFAKVDSIIHEIDGSYTCKVHIETEQDQFCGTAEPPHVITITVSDHELESSVSFNLSITPVNDGLVLLETSEQADNGVPEEDWQERKPGEDWPKNESYFFFIRDEEEKLIIDFNDYFRDIDGDPIKITSLGALTGFPMHGDLARTSDRVITFTPTKDYNSFESWSGDVLTRKNPDGSGLVDADFAWMTLTLSDPYGESHTVTIKLRLDPVNDPPVANAFTVNVDEDELLAGITPFVSPRVSDIDNMLSELALVAVGGVRFDDELPDGEEVFTIRAENGTVTWNPLSRYFDYMPDPDWNGTDHVTYTISDGIKEDSSTISIVVRSVHDEPRIAFQDNDGYHDKPSTEDEPLFLVFDEDKIGTFEIRIWTPESVNLLLKITPYDIGATPFSNIITPEGVKFSGSDEFRTVTLTPLPDRFGTFGLEFELSDGGMTTIRNVTVTVRPINDKPVITGMADYEIAEDTSASGSLSATDVETIPANMLYTIKEAPEHGTLVLNSQSESGAARVCTWTYTPDHDWYGTETFIIEVEDDNTTDYNDYGDYDPPFVHGRTEMPITVHVTPLNDPPTAPTNLSLDKAQYRGGETATLSFTAGTDKWNETPREDLTYDIEVSYDNGATWTRIATDINPTMNEVDEFDTFRYEYSFTVESENTVGFLARVRTHDTASVTWGSPALYSGYAETPSPSRVDSTAPTVSATANPTTDTNQDVIITLTIADPGTGSSGIADVVSDDGLTPGDGENTFIAKVNFTYTFMVTDKVGHTATTSITIGNIDKRPPLVSADTATITAGENKYADSGEAVTLTYRDRSVDAYLYSKQSGLATWYYVLNESSVAPASISEAWEDVTVSPVDAAASMTESIPLDTKGTWYIHAKVADKAGNEVIRTFGPYVINNSIPVAKDGEVSVTEHESVPGDGKNKIIIDLNDYVTDADVLDELTITVVSYPGSLYGTWTATATPGVYEFIHSGYGVLPFVDELSVKFYATDSDGETSATKTVTINVTEVNDKPTVPTDVGPTTDFYKDGDVVGLSWTESSDEETATADLKYEIEVKFNGGSWTAVATTGAGERGYDYTVTSSGANGTMQLRIRAVDTPPNAFLVSAESDWAYSPTYSLDNADPKVSAAQSPTADTNGNVTITLTVADPEEGASGIASVVSDDGLDAGTAPNTFIAEVNFTYTFTVTDKVGHTATASIKIENIDKLYPEVSVDIDEIEAGDGIYAGNNKDITLTYKDQSVDEYLYSKQSGLATWYYVMDMCVAAPASISDDWEDVTVSPVDAAASMTESILLNSKGTWYIHAKVRDNAGNEVIETFGPYVINNSIPVAEDGEVSVTEHESVPGDGKNKIIIDLNDYVTDADVLDELTITVVSYPGSLYGTWTATTTPGIYEFVHSGYGVLPFANKLDVTFYATDSDDAVSDTKTVTINVTEVNDKPTVPTGIAPATDFYKDGDVVELSWVASTDEETATTDLKYEIEISFNEGTWTAVATTGAGETAYDYTVDSSGANGTMQLRIRALDNHATLPAERSDWAYSPTYSLDNTKPVITHVQDPTTDTNGNVTITLTVTDSGAGASGVSGLSFVEGIPTAPTAEYIDSPAPRVYRYLVKVIGTYSFKAIDNVGNATAEYTVTVGNIDKLKPEVSADIDEIEAGDGKYADSEVEIELTYSDQDATDEYKKSDLDLSQYILSQDDTAPASNATSWTNYVSPIELDTKGTWYIHAKVTDNAGNEVIRTFGPYVINNSAPVAKDGSVSVTEHASSDSPNANRVTVDLRSYVSDVDAADVLTYTIVSYPGTLYGTWTATTTPGVYEFVHSGYGVLPFANKLYVTFYATDSDDVKSATMTVTINVTEVNDKPTTPTGIAPATDFYKDGDVVELSWTASTDEETATADLKYEIEISINNGAWAPLTTTGAGVTAYNYTVSTSNANGTMQLRIRALDNHATLPAETSDWAYSPVYSLDNTDPTISASQSPAEDSYTNGNVTITLAIADPGAGASGIASVVSGDDLDAGTAPNTFIATTNGTYTFTVTDKVGHTATTTITIENIDKLAPLPVDFDADATEGSKKAPITVTLDFEDADATADDAKSEIATSQYLLIHSDDEVPATPGSGAAWLSYTAPVKIVTKGIWYLYGRAVDNAGNETITYLGVYTMIDLAPVAEDEEGTVYEHYIDSTQSNAVTFTLLAEDEDGDPITYAITGWHYDTVDGPDAGSGQGLDTPFGSMVKGTGETYTFTHNGKGAPPFANKIYFTYTASDDTETSEPATITITVIEVNDTPGVPTNMVSPAGGTFYKGGQAITFSWSAGADEETATGDLRYNIYISREGGTPTLFDTVKALTYTYTCPSGENLNALQFFVETLDDGLQNSATTDDDLVSLTRISTNIYKLDNTDPTISASASPTTDTNGNVTITLTIADTGVGASGIASLVSDQGLASGGANTFTALTNGTYTFTVTDNVGHAATASITITNIDKLAPKPVVANSGGLTDGYEITKTITVTLTYEDADATTAYKSSGIATKQYILVKSDYGMPAMPGSGAAWTTYTSPIAITTRGTWYLYGRAVDNVGNERITYLGVYTIGIDPSYPYPATLTVQKDGVLWPAPAHGKTFTLKLSTDETKTADISSGAASVVSGVWKVYDGAEFTGATITIDGGAGSAALDYYSVTFSAIPAGMAAGAGIDASNGMHSGEALLKGKIVTLTAYGTVPMQYSYLWSGTDTHGEITQDLTVTVTNTVNVQCTVTGLYIASVYVQRDGILWGGRTVELYSGLAKAALLEETGPLTGDYAAQVMNGTYNIYVDGIQTGKTITVNDANADIVLDYYSLILVRGEGVSAVTGTGAYLAGKAVYISAALYNGYTWSKWSDDSDTPVYFDVAAKTTTFLMPAHPLILTATGELPLDPDPGVDAQPQTYTVTVTVQQKEAGQLTPVAGADAHLFGPESGRTDENGSVLFMDVPPGNHLLVLDNLPGGLPPSHTETLAVYSDLVVTIVLPVEKSSKGGHLYSRFSHDERVRVDNEDLHDVYETAKNTNNTDDTMGVTVYDLLHYEGGGDITIYLLANEADESTQQNEISAVQNEISVDGKRRSFQFDLSAYIRTIDAAGSLKKDMQLGELNDIVKVYITLAREHQNQRDYAVYRYHDVGDLLQNVQRIPEGAANSVEGEYFELSPDGKEIILHVRKFSIYAVAYNTRSTADPDMSDPLIYPGQAPATATGPVDDSQPDPAADQAVRSETEVPLLNTRDHFAYIVGYPDGSVHPGGMITREEVATILYRLLKSDVRNENLSYHGFTDMEEDRWSSVPVSSLAALGILFGYPDGSFAPGEQITRAEFVAVLARFLVLADEDEEMPFDDVPADHWAAVQIGRACGAGLVMGYPDGSFRPEAPISRAEVFAIINRLLGRHVGSLADLLPDMMVWRDNADPGAWYYYEVQEATNAHDYTRKDDGIYEKWEAILSDDTGDLRRRLSA